MNRVSLISATVSLLVHVPLIYSLDISFLNEHGAVHDSLSKNEAVVYYITDTTIEELVSETAKEIATEGHQVKSPKELKNTRKESFVSKKARRDVRVTTTQKKKSNKKEFVPTVENINLEDKEVKKIFFQYYNIIRERLQQHTLYPYKAKLEEREGLVYLSFILKRNGAVSEIVVLNPSGEPLLDQAAMNSIRNASPFPPFPKNLVENEIKLNVPISFELE
ncbi:energy transducer TonB [Candidatus Omnitrophota bacterium]